MPKKISVWRVTKANYSPCVANKALPKKCHETGCEVMLYQRRSTIKGLVYLTETRVTFSHLVNKAGASKIQPYHLAHYIWSDLYEAYS